MYATVSIVVTIKIPEEEDVIIFENACEMNYYKHEHICDFTDHANLFGCVNVHLLLSYVFI